MPHDVVAQVLRLCICLGWCARRRARKLRPHASRWRTSRARAGSRRRRTAGHRPSVAPRRCVRLFEYHDLAAVRSAYLPGKLRRSLGAAAHPARACRRISPPRVCVNSQAEPPRCLRLGRLIVIYLGSVWQALRVSESLRVFCGFSSTDEPPQDAIAAKNYGFDEFSGGSRMVSPPRLWRDRGRGA